MNRKELLAGIGAVAGLMLCLSLPKVAEAKNGILYKHVNVLSSMMELDTLAPPAATQTMMYYGGQVIAQAKVVAVFWGPSIDSSIVNKIGPFYTAMTNSSYMDFLTEYNTNIKAVDGRDGTNQTIGHGSFVKGVSITPVNTSVNLLDTDIQAELEAQIKNQVLPAADSNTLYMIYFPSGVSITVDTVKSCVDFCAYHNGFTSPVNGNVFYGVMPDMTSGGCQLGCGGFDAFANVTEVSSHEFMEAVTDPFPTPGATPSFPQAWNDKGGNEIGDLCVGQQTTLTAGSATYSLQKEYDNSISGCTAGPFTAQ